MLTSEAAAVADLAYRAPAEATPRIARRGARRPSVGKSLGLVLPTILLVAWEMLCRTGIAAPNLLPAPSAVLGLLWALIASGEIWGHASITLFRVFAGFGLGALVATLLGALTGYSTTYRRLFDPLLQGLRNIPSLAWVPLFVLWLGIFEASKIALVAVGVFFPVYLNLMGGIQSVDRKLVEVGRMYRLRGFGLVRRVLVPATLPAYFVGLRSGLGLGWMFVLAAEFMGASEGLGFLLIDGQMTSRPAAIIAGILLFAVFGKATDWLLVRAGRPFLAWQDSFEAQTERDANAARA
ncbi:MAG: ABC transporter permease [Alphaproteobacteria bacterium]|nr:ABC transporter permease [Alphaproteobacteria bacterium]